MLFLSIPLFLFQIFKQNWAQFDWNLNFKFLHFYQHQLAITITHYLFFFSHFFSDEWIFNLIKISIFVLKILHYHQSNNSREHTLINKIFAFINFLQLMLIFTSILMEINYCIIFLCFRLKNRRLFVCFCDIGQNIINLIQTVLIFISTLLP